MKLLKPIVITGFMGCGKSGVARELARRLNVAIADLDEQVTERAGKTPAQIIVEDGELAFRSIEANVLRELLKNGHAGVIALGGGAWIEEINRKVIDQYSCITIWLDAPFELCWFRIQASSEDRPLGKTKAQARALYHKRRPIYKLADLRINVAGAGRPDVLASRVETGLTRFFRINKPVL